MTNRNGRRKTFLVLAWVGLLVLFGAHAGQAQLPETINYQGRLSHAGGALVNGTLAMSFAIYNDKNAATPLWTESYAAVQVTNGQFSVDLGSVTPLTSLTFDEKYWLGITVGADPEMNPRKPFTSVGYAVRALHAQNADHSNNSDHATDSDDATHADDSYEADTADNADYATTAGYADSADTANSAVFATSAGTAATATSATNASHATTADSATSAGTAATATHALTADDATHATSADGATNATHATDADNAINAGNADFATLAGMATNAANAANAALADEATHAQVAEFSRSVKEEGVAIVTAGLRGGGAVTPGLAVYVDPSTAMDNLATWCPSPGEFSPLPPQIMPGVYEPGPTPLTPVEWVAIEGSGEDVTTVRLDSSLHPVDNAEIRSLTIELVAPSTGPAVDIIDDDVRFSHVTIESYPGASSPVVRMNGSGPGPDVPELRNVTVVVTDGIGVEINNGSPVLRDLTVLAQSTGSGNTDAIRIQDASPVLTMVTIDLEVMSNAEARGIDNRMNSTPILSGVHITGQVSGGMSGARLVGIRNQDASPSLTDVFIHLTGDMDADVLGMVNESNSAPTVQQVGITVGAVGASCGPEGIVGIRSQMASMKMYGATIINAGSNCPRNYGLVIDNSDVVMTNTSISVAGPAAEGISCQDSTVEMAGASVRSSGNFGILTENDCRFRIDHSVVDGQLASLRDKSMTGTTGFYLIGASKFTSGINQGAGHARFECIGSYEEMGTDSLNELGPDCR